LTPSFEYTSVAISTNGWLEFGGNSISAKRSGVTAADPLNAPLPVAWRHKPFLAAYWNDLVTSGSHVRYGTLGQAPGRVFIVDWAANHAPDGGGDYIRFQIQIHEGSNLVNVKYHLAQHEVNGQNATIGYQGPGGAAAEVKALICDGKILDDNRRFEGWSISPLPDCGNAMVDNGETCDDGDRFFEPGDYCDAGCLNVPCGKPTDSAGARPTATDALFTLRASVGLVQCDFDVCDINSSFTITATDALGILRASVGLPVTLNCPVRVIIVEEESENAP
jgi:hypothetical protein